jgi:hypothetical protein
MAEPYDVLASLNRMLESEERREQTRLQSSLALMQFAQQKRMQDVQLAGQRLELLQAANSQMMGSQAQAFLDDTGLEGIYLSTFKGGEADEQQASVAAMSKLLTKSTSKGGWNIPVEAADKIVGAVYASKAGNHSGVLTIGKEMYEYAQTGHDYNTLGKNLAIQFPKIGKDISVDRLGEIHQTVRNQRNILKEMFDFGQGDYDIDPSIGMDIMSASDDELQESLSKVAQESTDLDLTDHKSLLTGRTLGDDVKSYDDQIAQLSNEISGQMEDLQNNRRQTEMIVAKRQQGIPMTESDQQWLDSSPELKSLAETEIQNLNSQIEDLREERTKYKKAEAAVKLGEITSGGRYGMDYISY